MWSTGTTTHWSVVGGFQPTMCITGKTFSTSCIGQTKPVHSTKGRTTAAYFTKASKGLDA